MKLIKTSKDHDAALQRLEELMLGSLKCVEVTRIGKEGEHLVAWAGKPNFGLQGEFFHLCWEDARQPIKSV